MPIHVKFHNEFTKGFRKIRFNSIERWKRRKNKKYNVSWFNKKYSFQKGYYPLLLPTYTDVIQNNVVQGNDALIDIDRITTKIWI